MALDWNKEISLSTILDLARPGRKGGGGSSGIPTKKTMNLYQGEQKTSDIRKTVLLAIFAAVLVLAGVKFGVLDQFDALAKKQAELSRQQALLDEAGIDTSDYAEVEKLYSAYVAQFGSGSRDVINVLELVEKDVMTTGHVTSIVLDENTLTLQLEGVSLQAMGDLANKLEKNDMVVRTNVSSAGTKQVSTKDGDAQDVVSTLVVALANPDAESKE